MPRILIIGATGYIGEALSLSLLRCGNHTVYGLARTHSKATSLAKQEIIPILCPDLVKDASPLLNAISTSQISIVVACGADAEAARVLEVVFQAGKERLDAYQKEDLRGSKLGFIYTSGTWVHGSSSRAVSDLDPVGSATLSATQPPKLVSWRPAMEQQVLKARDVLDVMVVRPGLVYGRSCAIWKTFFDPVVEAANSKSASSSIKIALDKGRPALVHVDDVASGLHCAVEKIPLFSGTGVYPVFDLVGQSESMQEVFDALARNVGYQGAVELTGSGGDAFAGAMSTSGNNGAERAKTLLGWLPRRAGFVDGMAVYAAAFMAS
jgi:nucleoside-diphosphate-sugar epimerase